jgi:hypothetical protein
MYKINFYYRIKIILIPIILTNILIKLLLVVSD